MGADRLNRAAAWWMNVWAKSADEDVVDFAESEINRTLDALAKDVLDIPNRAPVSLEERGALLAVTVLIAKHRPGGE